MAKLIALLAIAAATYGPDQPAISQGQVFDGPDGGEIYDKLNADGVARPATEAEIAAFVAEGAQGQGSDTTDASKTRTASDSAKARPVKTVRVRLLVACPYGVANDVVTLQADAAKQAIAEGVADDSKAAVDYAAKLPQNLAHG